MKRNIDHGFVNITILAGLFAATFGRLLGKRRRFLGAGLSIAVIAAYTVLVGADCSYAPISPAEWIAKLDPQVVLLSVGSGDQDGRPSRETLDAISDYSVLRTDRKGWIELSMDGEQLWVEVERK